MIWPIRTTPARSAAVVVDHSCYEVVLREGLPADILRYVDGALLVDLWPELTLPREIWTAWQPVVDGVIE